MPGAKNRDQSVLGLGLMRSGLGDTSTVTSSSSPTCYFKFALVSRLDNNSRSDDCTSALMRIGTFAEALRSLRARYCKTMENRALVILLWAQAALIVAFLSTGFSATISLSV